MHSHRPFIIGYVEDQALCSVTEDDARKLTHINVAFGRVVDGKVRVSRTTTLDYIQTLKTYNQDLRVLLSVGGWGAGGFSESASSAKSRSQLAASAVELVRRYGLDGIDLDWEYPCYSVAGIASHPQDKENFTLLIEELRNKLNALGQNDGRHYLLTIAAGAGQYYVDGTQMDEVQEHLDYVLLMTYDMRGGFQTLTGHHTNLYTPTGDLFRISVDASVEIFRSAGVPADKIVIGAAFYSRMWRDVPNRNNGLFQNSPGAGGYGPSYADLVANYINKNGYTRYWDAEAQAPYLFNGTNFISYDDEESIKAKCEYIKKHGLAGIMFWEYSCDPTRTLLNTMFTALR
ncbi:MAG: glycoside hydrolase family 18 protein [Bacillota bacterium]|nr:glycoside hydrolase family 18 protein [Bacillota bacterium]